MIFYGNCFEDNTFSIYVNRPGLSFGYFHRSGGSISTIEQDVAEFYIEGHNERIFISMNKPQANKIKINDGNSVKIIEIDSQKPFAFILPDNSGSITIYDINGNVIEYVQSKL